MRNLEVEKYYDIPYMQGGRSFEGCDCFGLFWLWFLHERNVYLPDYGGDSEVGKAAGFIEDLHEHFVPVGLPDIKRHDVLYMTHAGEAHCGIILDNQRFLHTLSKIGVSASNIVTWKSRVRGVYRYANQTYTQHI